MSRGLAIVIEPASVERTRADVAVVSLFSTDRPLRGSAGRADWRLCGRLSALVAAGRLVGEPGEAALISTFGGLRAPLLLVLGAGERSRFDARRLEALANEAVARGLALGARTLALPFPDDRPGHAAHERRAVAMLVGAAAAVAAAPPPVDLELRLLVAREEVTRTVDLLRRARLPRIPDAVVLRLPSVAGRKSGGSPHEAGKSAPRGLPLVK